MKEEGSNKLYYSIGEVSRLLNIDQHVLRYWETEFKELNPRKRKNGKRMYREGDLETIRLIRRLLHEERYTIEGARRRLQSEVKRKSITADLFDGDQKELIKVLKSIRRELEELRRMV
jgi:DNA-binding transcriptional MerR regulator